MMVGSGEEFWGGLVVIGPEIISPTTHSLLEKYDTFLIARRVLEVILVRARKLHRRQQG